MQFNGIHFFEQSDPEPVLPSYAPDDLNFSSESAPLFSPLVPASFLWYIINC